LSIASNTGSGIEPEYAAEFQGRTLQQPPKEVHEIADSDVASLPDSNSLSENEANAIKDNIYSSLFYPDTTLQTVMNSAELDSLPPAMQQEIYTEIARQIDSGAVDLERFLPGYRVNRENTQ